MEDLPMRAIKTRKRRRGPSKKVRREIVAQQPRDKGKFATKNNIFVDLTGLFFGPVRLKKLSHRKPARTKNFSLFALLLHPKKRRRKKPVMQRSFLGRLWALINGDFRRYRRQQARKNSQILHANL
jgi:hypothetical protein